MEERYIHQDKIKQLFFLSCIVLLGFLLVRQLVAFLPALLGAITLYILMRHPYRYMTGKKRWPRTPTVWLFILGSFIILLIPIGGLAGMLTSKVSYGIAHSNEFVEALKTVLRDVEDRFNIEILNPDIINKVGNWFARVIPQLIGATFNTLGTLFFMYFILFFMLSSGEKMEEDLYEYVPLQVVNVDRLGKEIQNMVLSNAIGIPIISILQGVVGLIGYYIIGVKEPWFWFAVTCITAMLPVVGAALAYVPLAIIFFANQQIWQGVAMLIYGFGIIGTVDNVFRFTLAKRIGNVHPLITVFGVFIGLKIFGFLGLIFGPLLISLFILLLKIYSNEFFVKQRELTKP